MRRSCGSRETDRIANTAVELRKLGAWIEERPDGFVVEGPTPLVGTQVNSHGDHRLAMALAHSRPGSRGGNDRRGSGMHRGFIPRLREGVEGTEELKEDTCH